MFCPTTSVCCVLVGFRTCPHRCLVTRLHFFCGTLWQSWSWNIVKEKKINHLEKVEMLQVCCQIWHTVKSTWPNKQGLATLHTTALNLGSFATTSSVGELLHISLPKSGNPAHNSFKPGQFLLQLRSSVGELVHIWAFQTSGNPASPGRARCCTSAPTPGRGPSSPRPCTGSSSPSCTWCPPQRPGRRGGGGSKKKRMTSNHHPDQHTHWI